MGDFFTASRQLRIDSATGCCEPLPASAHIENLGSRNNRMSVVDWPVFPRKVINITRLNGGVGIIRSVK